MSRPSKLDPSVLGFDAGAWFKDWKKNRPSVEEFKEQNPMFKNVTNPAALYLPQLAMAYAQKKREVAQQMIGGGQQIVVQQPQPARKTTGAMASATASAMSAPGAQRKLVGAKRSGTSALISKRSNNLNTASTRSGINIPY